MFTALKKFFTHPLWLCAFAGHTYKKVEDKTGCIHLHCVTCGHEVHPEL